MINVAQEWIDCALLIENVHSVLDKALGRNSYSANAATSLLPLENRPTVKSVASPFRFPFHPDVDTGQSAGSCGEHGK